MRVVYTEFSSLYVLREHADEVLPTVKLHRSCSDVTGAQERGHTGPDWREDGREREEGIRCVGSRGALAYLIRYILCYLISYRIHYSRSAATLEDMAQLALGRRRRRRRRRSSRPRYQIRMLNLCKRKACL